MRLYRLHYALEGWHEQPLWDEDEMARALHISVRELQKPLWSYHTLDGEGHRLYHAASFDDNLLRMDGLRSGHWLLHTGHYTSTGEWTVLWTYHPSCPAQVLDVSLRRSQALAACLQAANVRARLVGGKVLAVAQGWQIVAETV